MLFANPCSNYSNLPPQRKAVILLTLSATLPQDEALFIVKYIYQTKTNALTGTDYKEIKRKALVFYKKVATKTKRRPYLRSAYFKKEKIFLDLFWQHLYEKNYWDRARRLKFFPCCIELIQKSHCAPITKNNPNKSNEILHRFTGKSANAIFCVQIKEYRLTRKKFLMSVFPVEP